MAFSLMLPAAELIVQAHRVNSLVMSLDVGLIVCIEGSSGLSS